MYGIARPCNKLVYIHEISHSRQVMSRYMSSILFIINVVDTTGYYLLSFIIITKKRQLLLPFIFVVLKSCISNNERTLSTVIMRRYLHIESTFRLPRYSPMAIVHYRAIAPVVYLGSVNYTSYETIGDGRFLPKPGKSGSPVLMLGFRPDQAYVQTRDEREFQRGPIWPRARKSRFLLPLPPSRLPTLALSNTRRFTILHYRGTNYNPQITFGVYGTGTAPGCTRTHTRAEARSSLAVNREHNAHAVPRRGVCAL